MKKLILAAASGHVADQPRGVSGTNTSARVGIRRTASCANTTAASKARVVRIVC